MQRQLHLNLFIHGRGHHEASWRHSASSPLPLTDIRYYADLAQRAEAALFNSIFLADQLALGGDVAQAPRTWLEPVTVLAALATATSRIGLIATASTTYTEPYNLARQFASIDHISNGRAAWNIVTSWLATAAENYGGTGAVSHADRYARGDEFMAVVNELWDSWAADAVHRRPGQRRLCATLSAFGRSTIGATSITVAGPLNMPRCPQGRPVLVQAGSSDTGRRFAARHAEAVFTAHMAKATAQEFYCGSEAAGGGRRPVAGACPDPAGAEPDDRCHGGRGAAPGARGQRPDRPGGRAQAAVGQVWRPRFLAFAARPPARAGGFPSPETVEAARSRTEVIINLVRRDKPTLRQLLGYLAGARGHYVTAGTPEQIADLIEDWFTAGAADGFNIMPPLLPAQLDVFSAEVIPLLQRRGLFRTEYTGTTLREHYALPLPTSVFDDPAWTAELRETAAGV